MLTINYPNHTYLLPNFLIEIKLDLKVNKLSLAPRQFPWIQHLSWYFNYEFR